MKGNLDSFLDSKIAEEQAKQRASTGSPSNRPSNGAPARRTGARTDSPKRPVNRDGDAGKAAPAKGPDPSEFIIEDEEAPSRVPTPKPPVKETNEPSADATEPQVDKDETTASSDAPTQEKAAELKPPGELPQDVRQKLRKLEKLESRYHGEKR